MADRREWIEVCISIPIDRGDVDGASNKAEKIDRYAQRLGARRAFIEHNTDDHPRGPADHGGRPS